jgi:hypothetical protein
MSKRYKSEDCLVSQTARPPLSCFLLEANCRRASESMLCDPSAYVIQIPLRAHSRCAYAATTLEHSTSTATLRCRRSTERTNFPLAGLLCTKIPSAPAKGPHVIRTRWPS